VIRYPSVKNNKIIMNEELYISYLNDVISRGSVDELVFLWKQSFDLGEFGREVREFILSKLPDLYEYHGMRPKTIERLNS
jgi:hypothetical protein